MPFLRGFIDLTAASAQARMALCRPHKADGTVPMFIVVPVGKPTDPLPGCSEFFERPPRIARPGDAMKLPGMVQHHTESFFARRRFAGNQTRGIADGGAGRFLVAEQPRLP